MGSFLSGFVIQNISGILRIMKYGMFLFVWNSNYDIQNISRTHHRITKYSTFPMSEYGGENQAYRLKQNN